MLPVNIEHEDQTTVSLFFIAVKRQAIASTAYNSFPQNIPKTYEKIK